MYAIQKYDIDYIFHKFIIKRYTKNEGDSAHSLIERQVKRLLRSGPIYIPETFVTAIRSARRTGKPFHVNELSYNDFYNVFIVKKSSPNNLFCKYFYTDLDFTEMTIIKNKNKSQITELVPCYSEKKFT